MCMGGSSSPPPPPRLPPPDPSIARREAEQSNERLANQQKDVVKRKNVSYAMGSNRRKLISSSGAGFLGAGENPILGG